MRSQFECTHLVNKMFILLYLLILVLTHNCIQASTHLDFKFELFKTLQNHTDDVQSLVILPHDLLASGSKDSIINIWNISTGLLVKQLIGHKNQINGLALFKTHHLISCSADKTIKIWDIQTNEILKSIEDENSVKSVIVLDHDMVGSTSKNLIKIWDAVTGFSLKTLVDHENRPVTCLAFISADNLLVSGSTDKTVKIWDLKTFEIKFILADHTQTISSLVVLPHSHHHHSNQLVASGSWDKTIKIWSISNGTLLKTLQSDQEFTIRSLASLRNGHLASASDDSIFIWHIGRSSLVETITIQNQLIYSLASLHNGCLISGSDMNIKIWKPTNKQLMIDSAISNSNRKPTRTHENLMKNENKAINQKIVQQTSTFESIYLSNSENKNSSTRIYFLLNIIIIIYLYLF